MPWVLVHVRGWDNCDEFFLSWGSAMLLIRKEQIKILEQAARGSFEDRMVEYLARQFPDVCASADEADVRESIRKGINQAGRHGITTEYDVARYIEVMYLILQDFDTGFEAPYAKSILENPDMDSHLKMNKLWEYAQEEVGRAHSQGAEKS